jgi:hypothetical protein
MIEYPFLPRPPRLREGRRSQYKFPGPDYFAHVFAFLGSIIICRLYKLTLSRQAEVTLQLKVSLSDLVLKFLAGLPLLGGGGRAPPGPLRCVP